MCPTPILHEIPLPSDRPRPIVGQPRWDCDRDERELVTMLNAFRLGGGVTTGDDLATLLRHHHAQPVSLVARWVVQRAILSFNWRGQTFVPLFQFDRSTMQPRQELLAIVRELADAFDDWEMGLWFAQPNSWLEDAAPVTVVQTDPHAVLRAAQADRFIALG